MPASPQRIDVDLNAPAPPTMQRDFCVHHVDDTGPSGRGMNDPISTRYQPAGIFIAPNQLRMRRMNPLLSAYLALTGAIVFEVTGTNFLQRSEHITKFGPSVLAALFYAGSFYMLAQALRTLPLGIAYGIWGGLGIILTAALSVIVFKQRLDSPALIGIGFIIVGVIIVNAFSKSLSH